MINIKTKDEFNQFIKNNKLCCVKFGAPWCSPCKVLSDRLIDVEKSETTCVFGSCDIDDDEVSEISSEFGIMNIPVLCFFKNGELTEMLVGAVLKDDINNTINTLK